MADTVHWLIQYLFPCPSFLPAPDTWAVKTKYSLSWTPKDGHIIQLCQMKSKNCLEKSYCIKLIKEAARWCCPPWPPSQYPTHLEWCTSSNSGIYFAIMWEYPQEFKRHQPCHCGTTEPAPATIAYFVSVTIYTAFPLPAESSGNWNYNQHNCWLNISTLLQILFCFKNHIHLNKL